MRKALGIFYSISLMFISLGFYKIFYYENLKSGKYIYKQVNAYVGGDAYNYIINSNYATAYFVLGLLFGTLGSTCLILIKLGSDKKILPNVNIRNWISEKMAIDRFSKIEVNKDETKEVNSDSTTIAKEETKVMPMKKAIIIICSTILVGSIILGFIAFTIINH